MNKQKFYENVLENYFVEKQLTLDSVCGILSSTGPVFGKLEYDVEKLENGDKKITFVDVHIVHGFMDGKTGKPVENVKKEDLNLSSVFTVIFVDENDTISVVEHGFAIFTPVNKENVLLLTSLIGKKIIF